MHMKTGTLIKEYVAKKPVKIGTKYGLLTTIDNQKCYQVNNNKYVRIKCKCKCGTVITVNLRSLVNKNTESCGCKRVKFAKRLRVNNKSTLLKNNEKRCSKCMNTYNKEMFFKDKYTKDLLTRSCKKCAYLEMTKKKYSLGEDELFKILNLYNMSCWICNTNLILFNKLNGPTIDHNHETGNVRGILCRKCNLSLHNGIKSCDIENIIEYLKNGRFKFTNNIKNQNYFDLKKTKLYNVKYLYKISENNFYEMINFSQGCCHACNKKILSTRDLCIDHCHATGDVRGILCNSCNYTIGACNDSEDLLRKTISYLENNYETSSGSINPVCSILNPEINL